MDVRSDMPRNVPMKMPARRATWARVVRSVVTGLFLVCAPLLIAGRLLHLGHFDLSLPLQYNNGDAIWQFVLSKVLFDTGWILDNPYLGAPDIAHWHGNASAQTSALHSVLMRGIAPFVPDAIAMQQVYYLLNFPLIAATSYLAARLLGVGRWTSCCIGLLHAFTSWRLSAYIYAYLANYFVIPLSVVPPIWILTGRLQGAWRPILRSWTWWASVLFTVLAALTDGYYAFFTLLLLGFAGGLRALTQRSLRCLVAPAVLALALVATAYSLAWPLRSFERAHQAEFLVDGKPDPSMIKHPFEAEVYSSSLKLMLAPIPTHRVPMIARLGAWMLETSDKARAFPRGAPVQMGALASALLIGALALTMIRATNGRALPFSSGLDEGAPEFGAILALVLFSFLCATAGGIGALLALVYPTIRAYDRFPLFTIFLVYAGAGLLLTRLFAVGRRRWRVAGAVSLLVLVPLAILDQAPNDLGRRDPAGLARFAAERQFIRTIEASVPKGTEIYQYPYSNYLINSPYYGWGAFAHVRFYLHSHDLRWSNGAFKNSPVDRWHMRLAGLPPEQLVTEVRAAGFGGLLVDRTVVGDAEYARVRDAIVAQTGTQPVLDEASRLAFWHLPPLGYRIVYGPDYQAPAEVVIEDPTAIKANALSRTLDPEAFLRAVQAAALKPGPVAIERSQDPEVFSDTRLADAGFGLVPIKPASALHADVLCQAPPPAAGNEVVAFTVRNRSPVGLRLNNGPAPIRVGLRQLLGADGTQLRGDTGYRVAGSPTIGRGQSTALTVPLSDLDLRTGVPAPVHEMTAVFTLVQEGVLWLGPSDGDQECHAKLRQSSTGRWDLAPAE